jgi:hypothetical protein
MRAPPHPPPAASAPGTVETRRPAPAQRRLLLRIPVEPRHDDIRDLLNEVFQIAVI